MEPGKFVFITRFTFVTIAILASLNAAIGQKPPDVKIDSADRQRIIEGALREINQYYVLPEIAKKIDSALTQRLKAGDYDKVTSAQELMITVNKAILEISGDKHLTLGYSFEPQKVEPFHQDTPEEIEKDRQETTADNFCFEKVEKMPGNIGYFNMRCFVRPDWSGEAFGSMMTFLASTDALIIDLRKSRGGSPEMVAFILSYFFTGDPVHYNNVYFQTDKDVRQYWTYPYVPGKRYLAKDVYVLTSKNSFSAAEALPKFLQRLNRATVIGEPTRGGTNPGAWITIHPHAAIFVPFGMPVKFGVHENKPNEGVKPDIETKAEDALNRAQLEILTKALKTTPTRKDELEPMINSLKKALEIKSAPGP